MNNQISMNKKTDNHYKKKDRDKKIDLLENRVKKLKTQARKYLTYYK